MHAAAHHLGLLQLLSIVVLLGGFLGVLGFAWGVHTIQRLREHRRAGK